MMASRSLRRGKVRQRDPDARGRRPAFTLLELVLVVVIIGMLGAIVLPRFSQVIAAQRVEAAARRIMADVALARRCARTSSSNKTITFDLATGSYSIAGIRHLERAAATYKVHLTEEPYRVTLAAVDLGGDASLIFNGYGTADTGGTVTIQVGRRAMRITVEPLTGQTSAARCPPFVLPEPPPASDDEEEGGGGGGASAGTH